MNFPFVSERKDSFLQQDEDDAFSLLAYSHNTIKLQDFKKHAPSSAYKLADIADSFAYDVAIDNGL